MKRWFRARLYAVATVHQLLRQNSSLSVVVITIAQSLKPEGISAVRSHPESSKIAVASAAATGDAILLEPGRNAPRF